MYLHYVLPMFNQFCVLCFPSWVAAALDWGLSGEGHGAGALLQPILSAAAPFPPWKPAARGKVSCPWKEGSSTSPDNECDMEGRSSAERSSEGSPWDKPGMLDWESALKTGAGGRAIWEPEMFPAPPGNLLATAFKLNKYGDSTVKP